MPKPAYLAALALTFALPLAACGQQPAGAEQGPLAGSAIGGPFTLVDAAGKEVRWQDFDGKYRIVYFGYTFCPDVCPTDVLRIAQGYELFKKQHPDRAGEVQPIFISIDPERDTPAKVGEFTHAFTDDMIGLTGTPEQIAVAAKAFHVYYKRGQEANGSYLMDHSNITYLMGRKGEPIAMLPTDVKDKGEAIAADIERWTS